LQRSVLSGRFGKPKRRDFTDYFSIQDRYSARPDFDSENTIGRRFRVNRAERLDAAFLEGVVIRQQWQIGDSRETLGCRRIPVSAFAPPR
jgi:hypothetical protein